MTYHIWELLIFFYISASGIKTSSDDEMTSYEIKQIQQQNLRLKDTLVKMRDLSAHDKHEYQKLVKDMEQKNSEIAELGKTKEKLSARVESLEQQIADLQEQVITYLFFISIYDNEL